jgi:hypothetical protein
VKTRDGLPTDQAPSLRRIPPSAHTSAAHLFEEIGLVPFSGWVTSSLGLSGARLAVYSNFCADHRRMLAFIVLAR